MYTYVVMLPLHREQPPYFIRFSWWSGFVRHYYLVL